MLLLIDIANTKNWKIITILELYLRIWIFIVFLCTISYLRVLLLSLLSRTTLKLGNRLGSIAYHHVKKKNLKKPQHLTFLANLNVHRNFPKSHPGRY